MRRTKRGLFDDFDYSYDSFFDHRHRRSRHSRQKDDFIDFHDDEEEDLEYLHYEGELFRGDVAPPYLSKAILNPRDNRFFPGIEPAGVRGITPKLLKFITMHVNQISLYVQGPPPERSHHGHHHDHGHDEHNLDDIFLLEDDEDDDFR